MVYIYHPTALRPMAGTKGLGYQTNDSLGSAIHIIFARSFAAMANEQLLISHGNA